MAYSFPSPTNTYVPAFDTTGNLVVNYSRNQKDFKVNQYITLTPVNKETGFYLRLDIDNAFRILGTKGDANIWPDGNDSPNATYNNQPFEFETFRAVRRAYVAQLGYLAVEQAAWDIKSSHQKMLGTQAMTQRTKLVDDLLLDSTQYDSTHVATATALGGGYWSAGSIANAYIQKAVMAAANVIQVDTGSCVKYSNLTLIINPVAADAMARSAEIRDFIAQSPFAMDQVRGNKPGQNAQWGLPDQLYGIDLIVEDTVYDSTPFGSNTQNRTYTWGSNSAVLCAKNSKDLVMNDSMSSFSTVHIFSYEEMQAETMDDTVNRRTLLRVSDNYATTMVSPVSGFLITNLFS